MVTASPIDITTAMQLIRHLRAVGPIDEAFHDAATAARSLARFPSEVAEAELALAESLLWTGGGVGNALHHALQAVNAAHPLRKPGLQLALRVDTLCLAGDLSRLSYDRAGARDWLDRAMEAAGRNEYLQARVNTQWGRYYLGNGNFTDAAGVLRLAVSQQNADPANPLAVAMSHCALAEFCLGHIDAAHDLLHRTALLLDGGHVEHPQIKCFYRLLADLVQTHSGTRAVPFVIAGDAIRITQALRI